MKQLIFLLICLLSLLQYRLWLGDNNLSEYVLLQTQIAGQEQSNGKLVARNQILKEEIIDLKRGTEAIEERARNELGMVKEGETFYRVVGSELRERNQFNR
ncbi:cell division protein FtsB [Shewanella frigidimarina]|jgi:cell division protein FtsB|uniref:cell division protein FtsB n=1 Tax=Shewanella TaxID=22 RepID=UPI000C7AE8C3|nr:MULTISPECIES: cell division protein FtsB [Shewanella]MBB1381105.1 cell division protein FtsB [Shewanella sp. SR41-2]MBB1425575.1 cell division protein FtsB [Shewanella sp. SG44-2]MBB1441036.1 cell division protein FtsB [Shewanella sp. SG41-4]PKI07592.1 cell division protein FtsB [Shewanella sp. 11B5]RPA27898.1 cell division protein FtsB [Shewanella frigidimarina]|tara:strand:- start:2986 stop:3288 length:303 start_codon:yes stop_codon:yes gene_type:complete